MTAKHFAVGDMVYVARAGNVEKTRPCRICAGERRVTLVLGSGEQVELDCDYCGRGYQGSTGVESYYEYGASAAAYPVTGIETVHDASGERVRYRSGSENAWTSFEAENCYATREEALASCAELVAQREAEQEQQFAQKEKNNKSYGWHAGYHLREAERAREQVIYHERKALLMKELSK